MQKSVRDIGSLFYSLKEEDEEFQNFEPSQSFLTPNSYSLFYTGRHAIFAVLNDIKKKRKIGKIWMPIYFCHNVINSVEAKFNHVDFYDIDPFSFNGRLNIESFADENDVILLNNYWGLRHYIYDIDDENLPIIIEDHSHGWRSEQCINSKADYAICSLRKTYPIPLGAIAWKPNGENLNIEYQNSKINPIIDAYSELKKAMKLKRQFLKSGNKELQKRFLNLLNKGEENVSKSLKIEKPSVESIKEIESFLDLDPNKIKDRNLDSVKGLLNNSKYFKIIDNVGFTPFGLMLLFKSENDFFNFKKYMIDSNIYPANLWPENNLASEWQYFFNIHVDFRYSLEDMQYLASKINYWTPN